jgi:hypothetical protein
VTGLAIYLYNEDIFITGCTCHLAASKAAKELTPVKIEDIFVDIFYYIDKSSKRHKLLREFQALCDTNPPQDYQALCYTLVVIRRMDYSSDSSIIESSAIHIYSVIKTPMI